MEIRLELGSAMKRATSHSSGKRRGWSPGSHSPPGLATSDFTVVNLFSDLHQSSPVSQGHSVVSYLTAQPCRPQWLAAITFLLFSCCKATTGLERLPKLPCQQCHVSCPRVLWQFHWSHSTGERLKNRTVEKLPNDCDGTSWRALMQCWERADSLAWESNQNRKASLTFFVFY